MKVFKYLSPFIFFVGAYMAFTGQGWIVWMPMCWAWILVPLSELFIKPDAKNMSAAEEELARQDRRYDWLLYATVFIQYFLLYVFLEGVATDSLTLSDRLGRIFAMGLLCGIFGINVAHELGHRVNRLEQTLAKALLLTSLYMHFFTEHNKGHHKRVATPDDPSSARYGEPVYTFYFRTIVMSYVSAWHIANEDCRKKNPVSIVTTGFCRLDRLVFWHGCLVGLWGCCLDGHPDAGDRQLHRTLWIAAKAGSVRTIRKSHAPP
jgi:alkane 1-monooxygenase